MTTDPAPDAGHAAEQETAAIVSTYFGKLFDGICPICDQPMTMRQVSCCVYADPCGHRLYHGSVPDAAPARTAGATEETK